MPDTLTSTDFIPQTVIPPEKPLTLVRGLLQMIDNPLYVWPRAMYENPYHGVRWLGRTFHYFRKPDHMKAVFLDHADVFRKSPFQRKLLGPAVGDGMLTAEGEHWKFQRRAASPAFRIDALRALVPAFVESAEATIERIKSVPAGQTVDVMGEMQHATLDVIVETILGGADPGFGYDRMAKTVSDYIETMGQPDMLDMFGAPGWIWRPWGRRKASRGRLESISSQRDRAAPRLGRRTQGSARPPAGGARSGNGRGPFRYPVRDNVVTFIGAGHETTALALTYALYLIANAPDVQDRLLREVLDVCGDRPIDAAMLENLTFHEQVIKEAMRLYPPVSLIDRVAVADIDLGDAKVKKGDLAFALVYVMHRHKLCGTIPSASILIVFPKSAQKGDTASPTCRSARDLVSASE